MYIITGIRRGGKDVVYAAVDRDYGGMVWVSDLRSAKMFTDINVAKDYASRQEFTNIVKLTRGEIELPRMLLNIVEGSIKIEQVIIEEVGPIDLSSVYKEFSERDSKIQKLLEEIRKI